VVSHSTSRRAPLTEAARWEDPSEDGPTGEPPAGLATAVAGTTADNSAPSVRVQARRSKNGTMHISAKVDYAMRALLEIAAAQDGDPQALFKGESLAESQHIPPRFLEGIMRQLRQSGIVSSRRGAEGGYRLARPASEVTVASVVRALDGPLAEVRGDRPEAAVYEGPAAQLQDVWVATRAALRGVLDHVTLEDIANKRLPEHVQELLAKPEAWQPR
jgi:Rrf2 family protein